MKYVVVDGQLEGRLFVCLREEQEETRPPAVLFSHGAMRHSKQDMIHPLPEAPLHEISRPARDRPLTIISETRVETRIDDVVDMEKGLGLQSRPSLSMRSRRRNDTSERHVCI